MSPRPLLVSWTSGSGVEVIYGHSVVSDFGPIATTSDLDRLRALISEEQKLTEPLIVLGFQRLEQPE